MLSIIEITLIAMLLYMLITSIVLISNLNDENLTVPETVEKINSIADLLVIVGWTLQEEVKQQIYTNEKYPALLSKSSRKTYEGSLKKCADS